MYCLDRPTWCQANRVFREARPPPVCRGHLAPPCHPTSTSWSRRAVQEPDKTVVMALSPGLYKLEVGIYCRHKPIVQVGGERGGSSRGGVRVHAHEAVALVKQCL